MEIKWRKRLLFLIMTTIVIVPFGLWNITTLSSGDPTIREKAYEILTKIRIPHHSLPAHWSIRVTVQFFFIGFVAAWCAKKHLFGQLLMVLMSVAAISVVYAIFFYNPTIAALAPWRVSVLAAPLSWIIILTMFSKWFTTKLHEKEKNAYERFRKIGLCLAIVASIVGTTETWLNYKDKINRPDYGISKFLARYHNTGYLYLIPPYLQNLRLEAGVPVYVTKKSHPTKDSEFLSWHERLMITNGIFHAVDPLPDADFLELLKENSLTHMIWPGSMGEFPYKNIGHKVYEDKHFSLWAM